MINFRRILLWLLPLVPLVWIGHGLLFTTFMLYDDEGYVLLTLRHFAQHGGLYDKVYTQYGPFFYAALGTISRVLGFEWTNTAGRLFTLVNWTGVALLCGLIVWRTCRLWAAAAFAAATTFALIWVMIQEPIHPGGLIALLVALTAWLGSEAIRAGRPGIFAIGTGILAACVALMKINVGAFLVLSTGVWLLLGLEGRARGPGRCAAWLVMGLLPLALMHSLSAQAWVATFAIVTTLSALSVLIVLAKDAQRRESPRILAMFALAGLLATAAVCTWTLATGTSLSGLLKGVVLEPTRHPGIYSFPVRWRPLVVPISGFVLVLSGLWAWRPALPGLRPSLAWLRLGAGCGFMLALDPRIAISLAGTVFSYGVPLAALFAIPLCDEPDRTGARIRGWLAALLALQCLQAYPIAGSQLNWGAFLWVPLFVLGVVDAVSYLAATLPSPLRRIPGPATLIAACGLTGFQIVQMAQITHGRTLDGLPLALPGAETIRLAPPVASALHVTAINARQQADMLFSLPGTFSFNQWTSRPTPTLRNVTHWYSLLGDDDQQAIIEAMEREPRAAFILQRPLLQFLAEHGFSAKGPLVSYLHGSYREILRIDAFALWIRKDRKPGEALLDVVQWETTPSASGARICIDLPPSPGPIASVEAFRYRPGSAHLASDHAVFTDPAIQTRLDGGDTLSTPSPANWPLPPGGLRRLSLTWLRPPAKGEESQWIFRFVGPGDQTLGFARFPDFTEASAPAGNQ